MNHETISVHHLAELSAEGRPDVLDVRTSAEFREVHAIIAKNVPLDTLNPNDIMKNRLGMASEPLYVICKSGARGAKACLKFIHCGYNNVVNVEGGIDAWLDAGLPVQRGRKMISLERQVRIAVGLMVLAGALLGIFLHPWFAAISVFGGGGLLFAGLTDSCAMGMLISKMPWNQIRETEASCPPPYANPSEPPSS